MDYSEMIKYTTTLQWTLIITLMTLAIISGVIREILVHRNKKKGIEMKTQGVKNCEFSMIAFMIAMILAIL